MSPLYRNRPSVVVVSESWHLHVENVLEAAAAAIGSKYAHFGDAGEDEVPKCGKELVEGGRRSCRS